MSPLQLLLPLILLQISTKIAFEIEFDWTPRSTILEAWTYPCLQANVKNLPFCNTSLSWEERATDLVMRLNLTEAIGVAGHVNKPIPSLGIPGYNWWNDAAHGLCQGVNWNAFPTHSSTMFAQTIGTGSSFNESLWYSIGDSISTEVRAFWNYNASGITEWDPNINIFRDPRWGRGQETPGEDPFVNSRYGVQFVRGEQGNDKKYLKVSTTCKHWDAYNLDNYEGMDRHHYNAIVSDFDMNDTYLPPQLYCVYPDEVYGGASSGVMCSYNEVNGIPSCANSYLCTEQLNKWGFDGYLTSDCSAVNDVYNAHHYTNTTADTCAVVFEAGMTIECGSFVQSNGIAAVKSGVLKMSDLQKGLIANYKVMMRLGMFDDPNDVPWSKYGPNNVNTPYHQQLALEGVQQGVVLFKNNQNILPLNLKSDNIKTIAVLGPNANNTKVLGGNYYGHAPFMITPLDAVQTYAKQSGINVLYNQGIAINSNSTNGFSISEQYAKQADLTILVMGIDQTIESEGRDRINLLLPGKQYEFITNISSVSAQNGGITILALISGGCIDVSMADSNTNINAILWGGYGGMYGGQGIADVVFGTFNPTGLTSQTWYLNDYINEVSMLDMGMRPNQSAINVSNAGRGYRYYGGKNILYNFGYGLAYTTFKCDNLQVFNSNRSVSVDISNTGSKYSSGAVVLVYWVPNNNGTNGLPIKRLVAFGRVNMINTQGKYSGLNMLLYEQFYWSQEYQSGKGTFMLGGACNLT
eukprot:423756_1